MPDTEAIARPANAAGLGFEQLQGDTAPAARSPLHHQALDGAGLTRSQLQIDLGAGGGFH